jgi:hypothetical protein
MAMMVVVCGVASAIGAVYMTAVALVPGLEPSVVYQIVAPAVVVEMVTAVAVP